MKTLYTLILGKILAWFSNSNMEELKTVIKLTEEAAKKFTDSKSKRDWVLEELKKLWAYKGEATLRYLLETALQYASKK